MAPPVEATPSTFDGFIESALQAYDAGRFAEARTLFRRAHELQPTARTLRTIGMCSFNLGDYVDAVWNLESSLTDTRKPLTEDHRRHASDLIARANPHIGRFRLRLSPADATLSVDGHSPVLLSQTELLLEPGRHEVEVRATGYRPARNVLAVDGGDRTTLELRLATAPTAAIAESDFSGSPGDTLTAGSGRRQPAASSGSSAQGSIGYVSLGLGAAGLVAFGVISGVAMADKAKLEDKCDTRMCGPTYYRDVDRYDSLRTASTITLIAGGGLTVLGAVLLLTRPSSGGERDEASIEPLIGPGSLGVRGRM